MMLFSLLTLVPPVHLNNSQQQLAGQPLNVCSAVGVDLLIVGLSKQKNKSVNISGITCRFSYLGNKLIGVMCCLTAVVILTPCASHGSVHSRVMLQSVTQEAKSLESETEECRRGFFFWGGGFDGNTCNRTMHEI